MSNCPSGQLGGNLGQFGPGEMVPEFDKAIFGSTVVGVLPTLVATRYGFHIVAVVRRIPGRRLPFDEVEAGIAEKLAARVEERALKQYIEVLAGRASIDGADLAGGGVTPGSVNTPGGARGGARTIPIAARPAVPPSPASSGMAPRGFALWNLGFRPFYLLAAIFAALACRCGSRNTPGSSARRRTSRVRCGTCTRWCSATRRRSSPVSS